jgi:hypothetical protein
LETGIRARLSPAEGRKFGLTLGAAFLALTGLLWWRGHEIPMFVTGALGSLLILAGLAIPGRLSPVHGAWMGLAHAISKVTTPVFMGIVYFVVLTPAGVLVRLIKGNPLMRQHSAESTWVMREAGQRTDMRRQF